MALGIKTKFKLNRDNISFVTMALYFVLHFFSVATEYDYIALEVLFLCVFFLCMRKISIPFLLCGSLLLVTGARYFIGHSSVTGYFAPVYHLMKYFRMFYIPILYEVFNSMSADKKQFLFWEAMFCFLGTNMISLYYVTGDPLAIRYRGLSNGVMNATSFPGIIRFSQIFSAALYMFVLIVILKNMEHGTKKQKRKRFIIFGIIVVTALMLIKAQLMTPLIILGVVIFMYLILLYRKNVIWYVVGLLAVGVGLLIYKPMLLSVRNIVGKYKTNFVAMRVEAIINTILGTSGQSSSVDNRMRKINISLSSLKKNPIVGIGYKSFDGSVVGCHQDFWDILAVSGISGFFVVVIFFLLMWIKVQKNCNTTLEKNLFTAECIAFLFLGFLDPCLDITIILVVYLLSSNVSVMTENKAVIRSNNLLNSRRLNILR